MRSFLTLCTLGLTFGLAACGDDTSGSGGSGGGSGAGGSTTSGNPTSGGQGGSAAGTPVWNIGGDVTDEGTIAFSQMAGGGVLLQLGGSWVTLKLGLEGVSFGETGTFDLSEKGSVTFIGESPDGVLYNCGQIAGGNFPEAIIVEATLLEAGHAAGTFSGGIHCSELAISLEVTGAFDF